MTALRFGACLWNQHSDWPTLVDGAQRAEAYGYDSVWVWDHLYPVLGDTRGPMLEGWMTIAGLAALTKRVAVGLLVGCNTFRNPALVAKMVTALDHISGGRAILGIGAGWDAEEHEGLGFDFGASPGSDCAGSPRRCRSSARCSTVRNRRPTVPATAFGRRATRRARCKHASRSLSGAWASA